MKIVIHGTKGGYHTFTKDEISFSDAAADSNNIAAIGRVAYSVRFNNNDIVFSKYRIIRDVQGDKRTGNIAFSLILKQGTVINGLLVKGILDRVHDEYIAKYIDKNNLENVKEVWSFLDVIISEYEGKFPVKSNSNEVNIPSAVSDPAYIYYAEDDILKYFENPIQRQYFKYKQVFFVELKYKSEDNNPLNALRHDVNADLTEEIQFDNSQYTISFKQQEKDGIRIEVRVNESLVTNGTIINDDDNIVVTWSKQYYESKEIQVFVDETDAVEIDDKTRKIIIKGVQLQPRILHYIVNTLNNDRYRINNADIFLKYSKNKSEVKMSSPSFSLKEIDIHNKILIWAKKGKLESEKREIYSGTNTIDLILKRRSRGEGSWYKKKKFIVSAFFITLGTIIIAAVFTFFFSNDDKIKNHSNIIDQATQKAIIDYTEGVELNEDTLEKYKNKYCDSFELSTGEKDESGFWKRLWPSSSGNSDDNNKSIKVQEPLYCLKIQNALSLRKAINERNIKELREMEYSQNQREFEVSIKSILPEFEEQIRDSINLGSLGNMNLKQISGQINFSHNALKAKVSQKNQLVIGNRKEGTGNNVKESQPKEDIISEQPIEKNNTDAQNQPQAKSQLKIKFWALVNSGNEQQSAYTELYKQYENIKGADSDILNYLKKLSKKNLDAFDEFKKIRKDDRINAKTLSDLKIEL